MLPEKLIYQSTFLVHLILKKKQYCPVLIAPQVAKELCAILTLTLKQHSLKKKKRQTPNPGPGTGPSPRFTDTHSFL